MSGGAFEMLVMRVPCRVVVPCELSPDKPGLACPTLVGRGAEDIIRMQPGHTVRRSARMASLVWSLTSLSDAILPCAAFERTCSPPVTARIAA